MSEFDTKPGALFWVMAVLFVLWGLAGCGIYIVEMTMSDAAYAEAYGADMAAARDLVPVWGTAGFAIAVWSGLLASILFILRKRLSVPVFVLSLVAAIIGFLPIFMNTTIRDAAGDFFWVMPLIVVVLGIVEILYSRKQRAAGILR